VQCSAVQCSAVQCSAVQCSAVQCSAVQCSAVQCSAVHQERVAAIVLVPPLSILYVTNSHWDRWMYSVQCTVYSVQCTVYSIQCTLYNVQCTVYSVTSVRAHPPLSVVRHQGAESTTYSTLRSSRLACTCSTLDQSITHLSYVHLSFIPVPDWAASC
jgi:hypothetical protein